MRFVVTSTELYNRLQSIGRVINSKNALPILDSFLFSLENGTLSITASDNETTLDTSLQVVEFDGNGQFAIGSKSILDAIKELPEQPIVFNINESTLAVTIEYMNGKFSMAGQQPDEYPTPAVLGEGPVSFSMPANILLDGINRTIFATADDELRPVMNGIYFDITTESITLVASDGHKLVRDKQFSVKGEEKAAFILPKKPANILKGLLVKEADDISISFDHRNAIFTMPNHRMVCRLIEGRYPNYNSVIPQNNPFKVTVNRQAMLSALRRVSVCSSASSSLVKLRLQRRRRSRDLAEREEHGLHADRSEGDVRRGKTHRHKQVRAFAALRDDRAVVDAERTLSAADLDVPLVLDHPVRRHVPAHVVRIHRVRGHCDRTLRRLHPAAVRLRHHVVADEPPRLAHVELALPAVAEAVLELVLASAESRHVCPHLLRNTRMVCQRPHESHLIVEMRLQDAFALGIGCLGPRPVRSNEVRRKSTAVVRVRLAVRHFRHDRRDRALRPDALTACTDAGSRPGRFEVAEEDLI